jgi:3-deoxy-D-manno-octulosonic-acid transferase
MSLPLALYTLAWGAALAAGSPYLLARRLLRAREMRERLGDWRPLPGGSRDAFWVHAASVGECRAAGALLRALAQRGSAPWLSVMTPVARRLEPQWVESGAAAVRFAPLDFPPCSRRVLRELSPRGLLVLETEVWPGWLAEADRTGVPVAFVSARLSARGHARLCRVRRALRPLLQRTLVAAQTETDAARWRDLGVPPARVRVTGNLKYETPHGPLPDPLRARLRGGWERIVVFGSVRSGEVDAIASAIEACSQIAGSTLCVVAPRHPERTAGALHRVIAARVPLLARDAPLEPLVPAPDSIARLTGAPASPRDAGPHAALLLTTVGELQRFYAIADAVFVGGTLADIGGHSLFEPAQYGVPVLHGPHVANVADVAAELARCGGGFLTPDADALATTLVRLLRDEREREQAAAGALRAAASLGGALTRTLEALDAWGFPLPRVGAT